MTIAMTIDAVSHSAVHWHAINWSKVYRTVRRLQARIVKANKPNGLIGLDQKVSGQV